MLWPLANSAAVFLLALICLFCLIKVSRSNKRREVLEQELLKVKQDLLQAQQQLGQSDEQYRAADVQQQQHNLKVKQQQQEVLQHLEQVIGSMSAVAKQSTEFAAEIESLKDSVSLLSAESTEQKLYGRAKKMIEMGAEVEELISECEVPRAEAELLLSLYKK